LRLMLHGITHEYKVNARLFRSTGVGTYYKT
jgi:hypothetical protein